MGTQSGTIPRRYSLERSAPYDTENPYIVPYRAGNGFAVTFSSPDYNYCKIYPYIKRFAVTLLHDWRNNGIGEKHIANQFSGTGNRLFSDFESMIQRIWWLLVNHRIRHSLVSGGYGRGHNTRF